MAAETVLRNMQGSGSVQDEHPQPLFQGGCPDTHGTWDPFAAAQLVHSIFAANTTSTTVEYQGTVVHARADAYAHGSL